MTLRRNTPGAMTPGRRRNANKENVYFEPGKKGRKTGVTLKDTGVRDADGFEPVSGIFSSPNRQSPQRSHANGQTPKESIAEANGVLDMRRTPRLPPPRSQSPRKSNIKGSPVRHSAIQPSSPTARTPLQDSPTRSPNRHIVIADDPIMRSIERSPDIFTSKSAPSQKIGKTRKSIFDFNLSPAVKRAQSESSQINSAIDDVSAAVGGLGHSDKIQPEGETEVDVQSGAPEEIDSYIAPPDNDDYMAPAVDDVPLETTEHVIDSSTPYVREHADEPNTKRKRGRPRKSGDEAAPFVVENAALPSDGRDAPSSKRKSPVQESHPKSTEHSSSKRRRVTLDHTIYDEEDAEGDEAETSPLVHRHSNMRAHRDDSSDVSNFEPIPEATVEPEEPIEAEEVSRGRKRGRKSINIASKTKQSRKAVDNNGRGPALSKRASEQAESSSDGASKRGSQQRLRSNTPFEDEGARITRSGRASIKPLAYWKNESFVWRNGEVDGVIRAHEIEQPKRKATSKRRMQRMGSIMEEEEDEDLLPEAWEEELGVINGPIRAWDAEVGAGSVDEEREEDVAFAARSIAVRDVQGSAFRYAKVITMDYFGAGMVELPPEGYKRSKNTRKMQMVFFVHQGKVTVEVGGMVFGLTKGGVWQVPRGNNYAITNESRTHSAKVFFAQGCEPDQQAPTTSG